MNVTRSKLNRQNIVVVIVALLVFATILSIFNSRPTLLPKHVGATEGWYDYNWQYRKKITIDHTKVPNTDQSNFPILISLIDADLQAHARNDGYDILFTDSTGTTKIPYEREQYTASSGVLAAWVNVAILSHSIDTDVYMYYGNSGASDQQDATNAAWNSSYKGVWHLKETGFNSPIYDSTSNSKNSIQNTTIPIVSGRIDGGASFNGINSYVTFDPATMFWDYGIPHTFEFWVYINSFSTNHWPTVINCISSGYPFAIFLSDGSGGYSGYDGIGVSTAHNTFITNNVGGQLIGAWNHIAVTYDGTNSSSMANLKVYLNGVAQPLRIGGGWDAFNYNYIGTDGVAGDFIDGLLDEPRLSDTVRSADWIQTEYYNQNDPAAFYSLGNETIGDKTPPSTPGIPQAIIGHNLTSQTWSWSASTDTGSGMSHYHWQVDGGPSGTTSNTTLTTNLGVGNWTFHIRAEDNAGNQSAAQSVLLAILSSSISQVTIDNSVPVAWIVTPDNVVDPVIDLSPITTLNGDLLVANISTELHLKTLLPSIIVTVDIPAGTAIKGSANEWPKVIIPPIVTSTPVNLLPNPPSGFRNQAALAIKIGHDVASLDLSRGARIFISGQAGKKVGHISRNVFAEITNLCTDDSQSTGDALTVGQDCAIESGSDLIIWSKHFSEFVTYDLVASADDISSTIPSTTSPTASNTNNSAATSTNAASGTIAAKENSEPAALQAPDETPALFDVSSEPVQPVKQDVFSFIILSVILVISFISLLVSVARRFRVYMFVKIIKEDMILARLNN